MSGIVGAFSSEPGWYLAEADLCKMRDTMLTRGPDDSGAYVHRDERLFVGLGHRHLSIGALSPPGHQPLSSVDDSLTIVLNGEIFNSPELRAELASGGCEFRCQSSSELLLHGLEKWGLEESLRRIRGTYAFALFDKHDGSLTLARDPLGVKPLYVHRLGKTIAFASEIKALLAMPGIRKSLNQQSLYHYLTFANAPAPDTFFTGISKLEAGSWLRFDSAGRMEKKLYWDVSSFSAHATPLGEQEYVDEVRRLLRQSVARRMVSDGQSGVFLSGGVDSSLSVALMAELMDRPVDTFSIGVEGDPANEFSYARSVAERFGARHHEITITDDDFISFLPRMPYLQDEPLADPACVPSFYLSKLAREAGTALIQVGEGSDEIFSGYEMHHFFRRIDQTYYQPYLKMPRLLKSFTHRLAARRLSAGKEDILRRAITNDPIFLGNAIAFWDGEKKQMLSRRYTGQTSSGLIRELKNSLNISDPLLSIINVELKNRLPELLLMRVDKMSMAHSIETRAPFLDQDLVECALQIPSALKVRNGENKYILKKAAEGILPDNIIYRKKTGFCGSATTMLSDKLTGYARENILSSSLSADLFNMPYLEQLFVNHGTQKRFNSFKIWNLLNLVLWYDSWFGNDSKLLTR
ncbi:MAG: asparagine synthase (glutamine-hydrolyzing) [Desulfuromonadales bacterium]|nr:asparagine synthase (glutamine-hydrolyzing) [Desulfuromonadales bacterium]